MRLCQVQTRASNALPRCRETNRRTPGTMARWHDGRILKQSFGPVPFHEKWQRFAVVNDGFANVSESENSDLGLCYQNRSTRQKKSPTTVHNRKSLPFFRIWGHDFLKSNGHSIKNGRQPAPAPKTKPLCPPGIRWQHPKWDPRPTKKTQRRRLEKSLGRDSKPPESQLPYNRQPPPRQRSSKAARAP